MHPLRAGLSLIVAIAAALNFQWVGDDGITYWAEETGRYPGNTSTRAPQLNADGLGYFSVGNGIDWPDFTMTPDWLDIELAPGAYLLAAQADSLIVAKAYQLHEDPALAFMGGATPALDDQTSFTEFKGSLVPVPAAVGEGALAGLRFAVKDIFHVRGLKTSGGSRSYYNAYGPQNFTNEVVERSLAAGAQLVGKTRTIAFALGTPLNGWEVDYQNPWSLRGDGYQSTGGSSSGSGAAIVAYDWLDFTIGSDTGGSVRFPARFGGFYGYKPTHGVFNLTGILPAIAEQDTPGHMARSPSIFTKVGRVWLEGTGLTSPNVFPTTLQYWSDEAPLTQPVAEAMKVDFFAKVEQVLRLNATSVNVTASFDTHVTNDTLNDYYQTVYQDQNSAQSWDLIGSPLADVYAAQNDGAYPPLDPPVNLTWADGVNATSRARYAEAVRRREQFATWFNEHILPTASDTCTQAIVAHSLHVPPSNVKVNLAPFGLVQGFYNGLHANLAGSPEIVVPIGQVQYESAFTRKTEWQPVTVAFAVAKGCDMVLFDLVDKLEAAGLIKEVLSGKVAYPLGDS